MNQGMNREWPPKFSYKDAENLVIKRIKERDLLGKVEKAHAEARRAAGAASKTSFFKEKNPVTQEMVRLGELAQIVEFLSKEAGDGEDWHIPTTRHLRDDETIEKRGVFKKAADLIVGDPLYHRGARKMVAKDYEKLIADIEQNAVFREDLSGSRDNEFLTDYPELVGKLLVTKSKFVKGKELKEKAIKNAPAKEKGPDRVVDAQTRVAPSSAEKVMRRPRFEVVQNEPAASQEGVTQEQVVEAEESLWPNAWFTGSALNPEQFYQMMMGAEKADVATASQHLLEICEEYLAERLGQNDLRDALLIYFRALYGEKELTGMKKRELHNEFEIKFHTILNNLLAHRYYSEQPVKLEESVQSEYADPNNPTKEEIDREFEKQKKAVEREEKREKWKVRRSALATAVIVVLEGLSISYGIAHKDDRAAPPPPPRYELPVRAVGDELPSEEARNNDSSIVAQNTVQPGGVEPMDAEDVTRGR